MSDEQLDYYLSNILVQCENNTAQNNDLWNRLYAIEYTTDLINESMVTNQNKMLDYFCVYTGCINLILMIMLLCKFLPAKKGVNKK